MKYFFTIIIICITAFSVNAQCYNYQSSMQDVDSYTSSAVKYFKKALKEKDAEKSKKLIDQAIVQIDDAKYSASLAQSYSSECSCMLGREYADNVYNSLFDSGNFANKAYTTEKADSIAIYLKKALENAQSSQNMTNDGLFVCE
ncbi:MAG: hypothetical protein JW798_14345 [Prolixibacteraceae bacterium]|nr:hypothetical protein [Prolixibacteraceae bacterium]